MHIEANAIAARTRSVGPWLLFVGAVLGSSACSLRQIATDAVADALAEGGASYARDDDVELIGAATPFGLKTIESLLEHAPEHRGLLLAAARGFTQYAYAYVQLGADEIEALDLERAYAERRRARRLYLRARDYGLRGLAIRRPEFPGAFRADPVAALAEIGTDDTALLYWTGVAWAAAIALGKDDPRLVAELPAVEALIARALTLDEAFDDGAVHVFLIGFEMRRGAYAPGVVESARAHFARAVALSQGGQAAPYVALAETVSVRAQDRAEFTDLLTRALAIDVDLRPQWRLANLVAQRRARGLLDRRDELFLE